MAFSTRKVRGLSLTECSSYGKNIDIVVDINSVLVSHGQDWCNVTLNEIADAGVLDIFDKLVFTEGRVVEMERAKTVKHWLSPLVLIGYPMGSQTGYVQIQKSGTDFLKIFAPMYPLAEDMSKNLDRFSEHIFHPCTN